MTGRDRPPRLMDCKEIDPQEIHSATFDHDVLLPQPEPPAKRRATVVTTTVRRSVVTQRSLCRVGLLSHCGHPAIMRFYIPICDLIAVFLEAENILGTMRPQLSVAIHRDQRADLTEYGSIWFTAY